MRLSIIIPVYNVEEYVQTCIMSCINQDIPLDQYEIIALNDGSTDSSLDVVKRLAERYPNIKVYSHQNQGPSVTRNAGIDLASGDYIWFVDSDDTIEYNCLQRILNEADGADMLAFGCKDFKDGNLVGEFHYTIDGEGFTGPGFVVAASSHFMHGVPFYLFRREFLLNTKLKFYPGIYHEDTEFLVRIFMEVALMRVSSGSYYHRSMRYGSITRSVNPKRAFDAVFVARRVDDHIRSKQLQSSERRAMQYLVPMIINNSLDAISNCSAEDVKKYNSQFRTNSLYRYFLTSKNARYMIEGIALMLFRSNPTYLYRKIKK